MADSKIEWCDKVWNPITGCTKVSAGCKYCYAERIANRKLPKGGFVDRKFTDVRFHPERLDQPSRWKKPIRIFVNSMSDLFHEDVESQAIDEILMQMAKNTRHTFQVLTKRPERMRDYFAGLSMGFKPVIDRLLKHPRYSEFHGTLLNYRNGIPPNNIWLGVSVEDQATADARIPILLQVPAAVRFVSYEPALGPVDFRFITHENIVRIDALTGLHGWPYPHAESDSRLDWLIVGGESGPNARPAHPDWFRSVRDQCQAAGVPFFFKQWGMWEIASRENGHQGSVMPDTGEKYTWVGYDGKTQNQSSNGLIEPIWAMARVGKRRAGRLLDGREWNEFPLTLADNKRAALRTMEGHWA